MELIDRIIVTKSRSIRLKILNDGTCILFRPLKADQDQINNFIKLKENWIIKHKVKNQVLHNKYKDLLEYKSIALLNEIYNIEYTNLKKNTQLIEGSVFTTNNTTLVKFIKKIAQDILIKRAKALSQELNIFPSNICIENTKSRWGVCTSKKEIKLNFRLVCLDTDIIDYVIIHELVHLIEFNHSKNFWYLVEKVIPNYKTLKNKLKEYSFLLELYR